MEGSRRPGKKLWSDGTVLRNETDDAAHDDLPSALASDGAHSGVVPVARSIQNQRYRPIFRAKRRGPRSPGYRPGANWTGCARGDGEVRDRPAGGGPPGLSWMRPTVT
jgi:hypothetical protein